MPGIPVTQGSKTAIMPKGASRPVVIEAGGQHRKDHAAWRTAVNQEARAWSKANDSPPLLAEPVVAAFTFLMPRPASAKDGAMPIGARAGDLDKLVRAAADALKGVVWTDDSLVVRFTATKSYGDPPGARIRVWTLREFTHRAKQPTQEATA